MNDKVRYSVFQEIEKEGWEIGTNPDNGKRIVYAYGEEFPLVDPLAIHFKVYRTHTNGDVRYDAMKRAHDILFPGSIKTFNYWVERQFREHCNPESKIITFAGGGGIGKTETASKIAAIFWQANPTQRAVITASTTLDSLRSRIFGYVERSLKESPLLQGRWIKENTPPPKIHPAVKDYIHGIYAVAANRGDDDESIKNWIGRHPKDALLLILDESTDLPIAIAKAIPNLQKGLPGGFQIIAIGNSNDIHDLHGLLSTPKVGWENITPDIPRWETTQSGGVCLYFNPYDSPAIHETDPDKKKLLGGFLMNEEKLLKAEQEEGTESEAFWRFTMGFWKRATKGITTVVTEELLKEYDCTKRAEFSGKYDLRIAAGLDPAFSVGGDKCILRLAVLGHHVNGQMVLDYRGLDFIFDIKIMANTGKTAEIQIADATIEVCRRWGVPLNVLCIDASGQGRGLAEIIQLRSGGGLMPTKIYSTNPGARIIAKNELDTFITSGHEMWMKGRAFILNRQIYGLDPLAYAQLYNRQIIEKNGKKILESKPEYRKRMNAISPLLGKSPDQADAAMLTLQSAIIHFGFHEGQKLETIRFSNKIDEQWYKRLEEERRVLNQAFVPRGTFKSDMNSLIKKRFF